jgi:hypothetical protein
MVWGADGYDIPVGIHSMNLMQKRIKELQLSTSWKRESKWRGECFPRSNDRLFSIVKELLAATQKK